MVSGVHGDHMEDVFARMGCAKEQEKEIATIPLPQTEVPSALDHNINQSYALPIRAVNYNNLYVYDEVLFRIPPIIHIFAAMSIINFR